MNKEGVNQIIEKWKIILTKMKEDLYAREFAECANGLKEKIYLSIPEIEELLILFKEKKE